jgi:hypothetical protein
MRSHVLSDALRAELSGKPLDYSRYRANYPNRWETIDDPSPSRLIEHAEGNRCLITFGGLVCSPTPWQRGRCGVMDNLS